MAATTESKRQMSIPLKAFLIGFSCAVILMLMTIGSTFLWFCGDVEWTKTINGVDDNKIQACPDLVVRSSSSSSSHQNQNQTATWIKRMFPRKTQQLQINYLIVKEDPTVDICRGVMNIGSLFWSQKSNKKQYTCIPKVITQELKSSSASEEQPSTEKYQTAYTTEFIKIDESQKSIINALSERAETKIENWTERAALVAWGGDGSAWFAPAKTSGKAELERLDGGLLFYSYLRIMKWPSDLRSTFPFKLCKEGCDSEVALEHTLEFREKFKPWLVSPSTIKENSNGMVFHHGFSPPFTSNDGTLQKGGHSLVWIRPGRRIPVDGIFATRVYVNVIEQAIAASMANSDGRVGKMNVVLDGQGFSWSLMPAMHDLKVFVVMLQDHFPDRLGIILLTNLGRVGEFVVGLMKPLISEEVQKKLVVLPHNEQARHEVLQAVVGMENTPKWLGGSDTFDFDPKTYYSNSIIVEDEESIQYTKSMPYHS